MNIFLNPQAGTETNTSTTNPISPEIENLNEQIGILKRKRLILDEKIKGEENKLKMTTGEGKKSLEGVISSLYSEDDVMGEEIKSLMVLIKKEEAENERGVDPFAGDQNIVRIGKREDK